MSASSLSVQAKQATLGLSRQPLVGGLVLLAAIAVAVAYGQSNPTLAVIWAFGLAFGLVLQRGRFCFASAFRDLYLLGDGRVLKGILAGMAVASIGFTLIVYKASPEMAKPLGTVTPSGIHTLLGGLLFGFGMVVAGGCASGTLYRIGEGYVASLVALVGAFLGMLLLAFTWPFWWSVSVSVSPKLWLPQQLGWLGAVALNLALLGITAGLVLWWESRSGGIKSRAAPAEAVTADLGERLRSIWRTLFGRPWPALIAGLVLGTVNVFLTVFSGPWGATTSMSQWAGWLGKLFGYPSDQLLYFGSRPAGYELLANAPLSSSGSLLNLGVVAGALIAALLAHEFKLRRPARKQRYLQALVGGAFWGYGARLALGCNLGAFFSAVPALAVSGWLFAIGMALGSYVGVLAIRRLA